MNISQIIKGVPASYQELPRYNPMQQQGIQSLIGSGMSALQNPYGGFEPIAQKAQADFASMAMPQLNEQFTRGMVEGGQSLKGTPAYYNALLGAQAGLQRDLAAQQALYGMQNRQLGLAEIEGGLKQLFDRLPIAAQPGIAQTVLPTLIEKSPDIINQVRKWYKGEGDEEQAAASQNTAANQSTTSSQPQSTLGFLAERAPDIATIIAGAFSSNPVGWMTAAGTGGKLVYDLFNRNAKQKQQTSAVGPRYQQFADPATQDRKSVV